ncbi:MAG: phytoene/squalene synthase family protein [Alphaproteobacteria bacterium]|nr:phytoene/squalene synthase family protein [Alphaproteobacteria bacterium]
MAETEAHLVELLAELPMPTSQPARVPDAPDAGLALDVLAKGSRSFSFAGWFLPADRRADAALLYALCRYVDDVADEAADADQARVALDTIAAELSGQLPARPFLAQVRALFQRRHIDVRHALDLIDGVASDLGVVRIADDAALQRYAYRVASTVGLMMCGVLGVTDPVALPYAVDLGIAMQLTNISRDVAEDARLGRIYLPDTRLRAVGFTGGPDDLLTAHKPVRRVVHDLLAMAERYYRSAEDGMRYIPWRARFAILVAARVYRAIGLRLIAQGGDALAGRTVVPWYGKLAHALRASVAFLGLSGRRAPHRPALHRALLGLPGADPAAPTE